MSKCQEVCWSYVWYMSYTGIKLLHSTETVDGVPSFYNSAFADTACLSGVVFKIVEALEESGWKRKGVDGSSCGSNRRPGVVRYPGEMGEQRTRRWQTSERDWRLFYSRYSLSFYNVFLAHCADINNVNQGQHIFRSSIQRDSQHYAYYARCLVRNIASTKWRHSLWV